MTNRKLICIGCPMGCLMQVKIMNDEVTQVSGNTCKKGEEYARKEVTNPTRIVTSTVTVKNGILPMVSVKTSEDIPKDKIFECMQELKGLEVLAPVSIGTIIKKNVAGTGINIVATKEVAKA